MIPLTGEYYLYPLRVAPGPQFFGYWTIIALILIGGIFLLHKYSVTYKTPEPIAVTPDPYSIDSRIQELQEINTSLRTPTQKAEAVFNHLYAYVGIDLPEEVNHAKTLHELSTIPGSEPLMPFFAELYEILFGNSATNRTHAHMKSLISRIITHFQGM